MAPPSPRRSSRARATNSQSQQSSSSSGTSGRLERSTRSVNKPSSEKSTPSASLSSEPLDDLDDTLLGRRRKRGQNDDTDRNSRSENTDMANGSDDLQDDEDEAVRCLCGSEDYPGPPPVDSPDAEIFAAIDLTDEVTGFFVQCDICKVWQHGACVGIFSAESSPDEYFCEQCRKDLHKIHTAANGTKYSKYLPLNRASRATSRATSIAKDDKNGSSKNSRPSTATQSSKRRSTMNSRDAAYDDEQLRRAIEASKEDNALETVEGATRRAKRGRSDSEDNNNASIKRQRTSSRSASPPAEKQEPVDEQVSDDETETRNGAKKSKNNQQHREKSEKEDRERQRQEAANKRKGRAERRRAEDSDLSEEMPLAAAKAVQQKPAESPSKEESPSVAQPPGTPPPTHPTASSSHKRGARANKRGKGRNQYSKDRDQDDESPARSMSRDIQKGDEATTTGHSKSSVNEHKTSKAKASTTNKMSMLDMKRRVAALMEFISRTQVDLAAEASFSQSSSGRETPQEKPEPNQTNGSTVNGHTPDPFDMSRFKGLSCMEMMDVLTRVMVKWQNQYS
ncbi:Histone deacetylase complex subunit [Metarhizium acridum]|uniref:Histone deacetylase complex subunit n=1 Tax=Metarhizium acridum TaxID=92637 RepID=UPI001C6C01AB|nr:Histone deacetylase complex subunit [Metarhizium acridum]